VGRRHDIAVLTASGVFACDYRSAVDRFARRVDVLRPVREVAHSSDGAEGAFPFASRCLNPREPRKEREAGVQWRTARADRADRTPVLGAGFPQILAAARTGSEWAWASLYRDLTPSVLGFARARRAADPEDLAGEVFLHVVRDLRGFEGGEREFRAWVFAVAHHRLIDDRRRRARRPSETSAEPSAADEPRVAGAEEEALDALAAERIRLERLSPDQRDVLLLRIFGDLTVEDVAQVLGKRPGAVKALQRRGLLAVRNALAKEGVTL